MPAADARIGAAMGTKRGETGRRWYGTWFWRGLTLLGLGLALVALEKVQVTSAGSGTAPPVLADYTLLLPNLLVMLGFVTALVGAVLALVTTCSALVNVVRNRRTVSTPGDDLPRGEDRRRLG
ncbi:hypothetical protein JMJ55_04540 [Belnapia sp. T6]|uniref:Uncharacterized protein n=1 Tax=Belnapia mucosa TaxID=2804532 RepID=A0ABS1V0I3_9PROT|nr:hypothetical protein [Belnapia mucosa]MBL6454581.1 hypothetical protein [Belnapia mucosa]